MDFYSSLDSIQLDIQKPTIFEVASCAQVDSLLTPSLQFLLAHYTHRYPRLLIRVLNNFDELNTLIRGLIEYKYLQTWNSTFIEKFYGIKRVSSKVLISSSPNNNSMKFNNLERLSKLQILLSLFDTVGVPYLAAKLQRYHQKLVPEYLLNTIQIEQINEKSDQEKSLSLKLITIITKIKNILKDKFFHYYPVVKLALKIFTLLLHILYLSNKISSISIIQLLSKVSLARITAADHQRMDQLLSSQKNTISSLNTSSHNVPPTLSSTILSSVQSIVQPLRKLAWSTTDTVLPISIFLLKFLEWYNSNRPSQGKDSNNSSDFQIPIVPSILPIKALKDEKIKSKVITSSQNSSLCRICEKQIHNPAVIETGYVFCYKCIHEYLRDQLKEDGGKCPITGRKLLGCSWSDSKDEWTIKGLRRVII
jgi:peroxin-12